MTQAVTFTVHSSGGSPRTEKRSNDHGKPGNDGLAPTGFLPALAVALDGLSQKQQVEQSPAVGEADPKKDHEPHVRTAGPGNNPEQPAEPDSVQNIQVGKAPKTVEPHPSKGQVSTTGTNDLTGEGADQEVSGEGTRRGIAGASENNNTPDKLARETPWPVQPFGDELPSSPSHSIGMIVVPPESGRGQIGQVPFRQSPMSFEIPEGSQFNEGTTLLASSVGISGVPGGPAKPEGQPGSAPVSNVAVGGNNPVPGFAGWSQSENVATESISFNLPVGEIGDSVRPRSSSQGQFVPDTGRKDDESVFEGSRGSQSTNVPQRPASLPWSASERGEVRQAGISLKVPSDPSAAGPHARAIVEISKSFPFVEFPSVSVALQSTSDQPARNRTGPASTQQATERNAGPGDGVELGSRIVVPSSSSMLGNAEKSYLYKLIAVPTGSAAGSTDDKFLAQHGSDEQQASPRDVEGRTSLPNQNENALNNPHLPGTKPDTRQSGQRQESPGQFPVRDAKANSAFMPGSTGKDSGHLGASVHPVRDSEPDVPEAGGHPARPELQTGEKAIDLKSGETTKRAHIQTPTGTPDDLHASNAPKENPETPAVEAIRNSPGTEEVQSGQSGLGKGLLPSGLQSVSAPPNTELSPAGFLSQKTGFDPQTIFTSVAASLAGRISHDAARELQQGVSELRLQLKPESLGEMSLKVRIDDEKVTAQIHVTQPEVRAALESSLPQLRDALSLRGIEVQHIDISGAGDAPARESRGEHDAKQRSSAKQRESEAPGERYKGTRLMGYNTIEVVM